MISSSMKRILVTGGFGFIGGHLIERLLRQPGNRVHVVDNLSSNPIPYEQLLAELGDPGNLTYDLVSVSTYCLDVPPKFDEIYHLASPVGPAGVLKHAGQMVKKVVNDAYHLMDMALRDDAKLLDVSTSEVYGGGQNGLCSEAMSRRFEAETTVRMEYAIAKLAAETAIINTAKVSPLRVTIVRPFNVAGPRQSPVGGFVLPRFIEQAMQGKPLTVFGRGKQRRTFTHVADIADGLTLVMAKGRNGEVYNLGNPANGTTILKLAQKVCEVVGVEMNIVYVDPKTIFGPLYAEAADKWADATKAMIELGWTPVHGIGATIRDAWMYLTPLPPLHSDREGELDTALSLRSCVPTDGEMYAGRKQSL